MRMLADAIHSEWDCRAFDNDPLRHAPMERAGKRHRKLSQDVRLALQQAAAKRRISAQTVSDVSGVGASNCRSFVDARLASLMAAGLRTFEPPAILGQLVLCVAFDGLRIGRPLEETITYALDDAAVATWGPPMVSQRAGPYEIMSDWGIQ